MKVGSLAHGRGFVALSRHCLICISKSNAPAPYLLSVLQMKISSLRRERKAVLTSTIDHKTPFFSARNIDFKVLPVLRIIGAPLERLQLSQIQQLAKRGILRQMVMTRIFEPLQHGHLYRSWHRSAIVRQLFNAKQSADRDTSRKAQDEHHDN